MSKAVKRTGCCHFPFPSQLPHHQKGYECQASVRKSWYSVILRRYNSFWINLLKVGREKKERRKWRQQSNCSYRSPFMGLFLVPYAFNTIASILYSFYFLFRCSEGLISRHEPRRDLATFMHEVTPFPSRNCYFFANKEMDHASLIWQTFNYQASWDFLDFRSYS